MGKRRLNVSTESNLRIGSKSIRSVSYGGAETWGERAGEILDIQLQQR